MVCSKTEHLENPRIIREFRRWYTGKIRGLSADSLSVQSCLMHTVIWLLVRDYNILQNLRNEKKMFLNIL